jgi:hypothetical protein
MVHPKLAYFKGSIFLPYFFKKALTKEAQVQRKCPYLKKERTHEFF